MEAIKVVVHGALGRMGGEVVSALCREPGVTLVGAVDLEAKEDYLRKPDGSGAVPLASDLDYILVSCQPDVMVDFSIAQATMPAVRVAVDKGVNLVIGTTGLTPGDIKEIEQLCLEQKTKKAMSSMPRLTEEINLLENELEKLVMEG